MKKILAILLIFAALASHAQYRLSGNGFYIVRNNKLGAFGISTSDTLWYADSLKIKDFKPYRPGAYTTVSAPAAASFPGYIIWNIDSLKHQYSTGSAWLNLPGTAGSGGSGSADSTIFATLYRLDTAKANIRASIPSIATSFVYDGNTKGAIPVFGTNDNFGLDFETNNVVRHRLQADGTFVFGGTTDVSQLVHINGDLRLSGTITCPTTSGFSMLTGASFSSFGATDVTNAFAFGYQNTLTNIGATRTLVNNTINVTTSGATTQTISGYKVGGTINNTAGTTTLDGFSVGWTLTSVTGTNVRSFTNDNGDNWFNRSAGNTGIGLNSAPSAKLHVSGSVRTDLGSDATGDIFYRSSGGNWARLGLGTAGQILQVNSGATAPEWGNTISTGTYTPTLTNVLNSDASSVYGTFYYQRIGNQVTVTGVISIDPTSATTQTQVDISLPIASDLAQFWQLTGQAAANATVNTVEAGAIVGDVTNNRAILAFLSGSFTGVGDYTIRFTYEVL